MIAYTQDDLLSSEETNPLTPSQGKMTKPHTRTSKLYSHGHPQQSGQSRPSHIDFPRSIPHQITRTFCFTWSRSICHAPDLPARCMTSSCFLHNEPSILIMAAEGAGGCDKRALQSPSPSKHLQRTPYLYVKISRTHLERTRAREPYYTVSTPASTLLSHSPVGLSP